MCQCLFLLVYFKSKRIYSAKQSVILLLMLNYNPKGGNARGLAEVRKLDHNPAAKAA